MRALRATVWVDPYAVPFSTVALESDTIDTLESVREQLRRDFPTAFVVYDIFESEHDDIASVTIEAGHRQARGGEQEAHQAMLFYWVVLKWGDVSPPGALIMDKPAPLSREAYEYALAQLALHPDKPPISIIGVSNDGHGLILDPKGEIHVQELGPES